MSKVSSSPERHTFQKENYIKRQEEQGLEPLEEYIAMFNTWRNQDEANIVDPEWQKNNMEYDLRSTAWILDKVRGDDVYAQNLYAAMCNNDFQKLDVWPILKDERWSCSWRSAGGIIADMQEKGDYMDWYCSGIRDARDLADDEFQKLTVKRQEIYMQNKAYVGEGFITDEIRADLKKLGWTDVESTDDQV